MNNIKRLLSLALVFIMVFSFAGCHKKDEIAVTVGDVEFTSAYYMLALVSADSEAKSKVYEKLTDEEKQKEIDYYSKEIDGKKFTEWVEDKAIEQLKEIAAFKTLCKENKIELSDETMTEINNTTDYYWQSYSAFYEPNGVGKNTYVKNMTDTYYAEEYFKFIYGEGGKKAIASDEEGKTL